jgi:Fe-S-cluster containining protein
MEQKFKCSMCSFCCSNLGRKSNEKPSEEKKEESQLNLIPPFQLYPKKDGLHLYEFEYKKLKKLAEDKGIKVKFSPFMILFDLNTDKCLVLDWFIDEKICPFLKDNKCIIYDERPLLCRRYPLIIQSAENSKLDINFGYCPSNLKEKNSVGKIKKYYKEILDSAIQDYNTQKKDKIIILEAIKKKIIRPAVRYRMDFLRKRADKAEKISIYDFLGEKRQSI